MNSQMADENLNIEQDLRNRLQDRWNLSRDPFAARPDFFYEGADRRHLLQQLRHLAGFGDRLIWICGAAGIGKTRLIAEFCRLEQSGLDIQLLDATSLQSLQALTQRLRDIAKQRASAPSADFATLTDFFRWSQTLPGRGKRVVLVLDNAQAVPAEILQGLLDGFAQSDRSLAALPIVAHDLSMEQAFAGPLDAGSLACVHQMALPTLSRRELADFLQSAFRLAGAANDIQLGRRQIERIFAASNGNLGLVQRRAPALLLELSSGATQAPEAAAKAGKTTSSRPAAGRKTAVWRWLLVAAFLLTGSFALIYREYSGSSMESSRETVQLLPQRPMIHNGAAPDEVRTSSATLSHPDRLAKETVGLSAKGATAKPVLSGGGALSSAARPTALASAPSPRVSSVLSSSLQASSPQALHEAKPLAKPAISGAAGMPGKPESATRSAKSASKPSSTPRQLSSHSSRKAGPSHGVEKNARITSGLSSKPEPPQASGTPNQAASGFTPARPAKYTPIRQLARGSGLVVQLSGSYSEKAATDLMDRYPSIDMHYTRSEYHGKPWYVIYLGPFKDAAKAHRALKTLPRRLRQAGPWVRSVKGF